MHSGLSQSAACWDITRSGSIFDRCQTGAQEFSLGTSDAASSKRTEADLLSGRAGRRLEKCGVVGTAGWRVLKRRGVFASAGGMSGVLEGVERFYHWVGVSKAVRRLKMRKTIQYFSSAGDNLDDLPQIEPSCPCFDTSRDHTGSSRRMSSSLFGTCTACWRSDLCTNTGGKEASLALPLCPHQT